MDRYVNIFRAVAEPTRLRILRTLLAGGRELCICDIIDVLELAQYNISKHMKELRIAGLVSERKEGRYVHYSLSGGDDRFMHDVLAAVAAIPSEEFSEDALRLKKRLAHIENKAERPCETTESDDGSGCCGKKRRDR